MSEPLRKGVPIDARVEYKVLEFMTDRNLHPTVREGAARFGLALSTISSIMRRNGYRPQKVTLWSRQPPT